MKLIKLSFLALLLVITSDVFASSNPIPGVGIVVKRNPGSSTARTTTDKEGNWKIEGLEPGTYTVEVVQADVDKFFAGTSTSANPSKRLAAMDGNLSLTNSLTDNGNKGNAGNTGMSGGIAEICVSSCDQLTLDGATKKAGSNKFYEAGSTLTVTVGPDGVISGQLRAGISTSRSNIRTK